MKFTFLKKHSTVVVIISLVVLVIAGIAARAASKKKITESTGDKKPLVQLLSVKNYSQGSHLVSANGTVNSLQQVDLKSQASGKVTQVKVAVGDHVTAGQILVTTDQGAAGAAATSAQGLLAQAKANYERVLAGASNEDIAFAQVTLDNAKSTLETTIKQQTVAVANAYQTLLNTGLAAIPGSGNAPGTTATITGTYTGSQKGDYKITIYATGVGLRYQVSGLESGEGYVDITPQPIGTKGLYVQFSNTLVPVNNVWTVSIPNTQATSYVANSNAYQAAVQTQEGAVTAAQNAVASAQAALDLKKSQARPADVAAAQAQIISAQGQVQAAQTAYENTIVRSPFSGTVSALTVKYADLLSPGQKVATIVNQGGLQVKVFVSDADLPFIKTNSIARIGNNNATGTITNLSPSVDPTTRTAEVDIAVSDPASSGLTIGQNVPVTITGSGELSQAASFLLPVQSVKFTSDGKMLVYIVDEGNKVKEAEVTTGKINGEQVEVTTGLSDSDIIVSNAYDVSAGDTVQVEN
jgi:RND family efflux transporter MFP subunit